MGTVSFVSTALRWVASLHQSLEFPLWMWPHSCVECFPRGCLYTCGLSHSSLLSKSYLSLRLEVISALTVLLVSPCLLLFLWLPSPYGCSESLVWTLSGLFSAGVGSSSAALCHLFCDVYGQTLWWPQHSVCALCRWRGSVASSNKNLHLSERISTSMSDTMILREKGGGPTHRKWVPAACGAWVGGTGPLKLQVNYLPGTSVLWGFIFLWQLIKQDYKTLR